MYGVYIFSIVSKPFLQCSRTWESGEFRPGNEPATARRVRVEMGNGATQRSAWKLASTGQRELAGQVSSKRFGSRGEAVVHVAAIGTHGDGLARGTKDGDCQSPRHLALYDLLAM